MIKLYLAKKSVQRSAICILHYEIFSQNIQKAKVFKFCFFVFFCRKIFDVNFVVPLDDWYSHQPSET